MESIAFVGAAMVIGGLVGQGFEMKKIRESIRTDEQQISQNIFADKRNFKWYAIIVAGFALWYALSGN